MQALKTTNARLTTALQESMTNVDQWHRQLSIYKDENESLKKQVSKQPSSYTLWRRIMLDTSLDCA